KPGPRCRPPRSGALQGAKHVLERSVVGGVAVAMRVADGVAGPDDERGAQLRHPLAGPADAEPGSAGPLRPLPVLLGQEPDPRALAERRGPCRPPVVVAR